MIISSERTSSDFLKLNNCAKQFPHGGYSTLRENGRCDWHILYITEGSCEIEENGVFFRVKAGNIILFKPFERQYYKFSEGEKHSSYYIHFCGVGCEKLLEKLGIVNRVTHIGLSGSLDNLFSKMCEEHIVKKPFCEDVATGILYELLAKIGRYAQYNRNGNSINKINGMNKICKMMYNEISQNKPMKYYADACFLSVDRFSHNFKECVGISPKKYIQKLKADIACGLLSDTDLSLSEIGEMVGISDVNYFCRMIKIATGHTPLYFRK